MKRSIRRSALHPRPGFEENVWTILGIIAMISIVITLLKK
jgi:hypothetical protein